MWRERKHFKIIQAKQNFRILIDFSTIQYTFINHGHCVLYRIGVLDSTKYNLIFYVDPWKQYYFLIIFLHFHFISFMLLFLLIYLEYCQLYTRHTDISRSRQWEIMNNNHLVLDKSTHKISKLRRHNPTSMTVFFSF